MLNLRVSDMSRHWHMVLLFVVLMALEMFVSERVVFSGTFIDLSAPASVIRSDTEVFVSVDITIVGTEFARSVSMSVVII